MRCQSLTWFDTDLPLEVGGGVGSNLPIIIMKEYWEVLNVYSETVYVILRDLGRILDLERECSEYLVDARHTRSLL